MNAGSMVTGSLVGSALTLGITSAGAAVGAVTGAALEADKMGGGGGGTIKIDIEQAPAIIAEIDKAIARVQAIARAEYGASRMSPPGNDAYSRYAVGGISDAVQRHQAANDAYRKILTDTRIALQKSFEAYRRGDAQGAQGILSAGSA